MAAIVYGMVLYFVLDSGWPAWAAAPAIFFGFLLILLWFDSIVLKGKPASSQGNAPAGSQGVPLS